MIERRSFPYARKAVADARHFAVGLLGEEPPAVLQAVTLMVSELATNAVVHARSAFELVVDRSPDQIRIEIWDNGPGKAALRDAEIYGIGGRGLRIVEGLADRWGTAGPSHGWKKSTWFELETADAGLADVPHAGRSPVH